MATLKTGRSGKAFRDKLIKDDMKTYREGQQAVVETFVTFTHGNASAQCIVDNIREEANESLTELRHDMELKREQHTAERGVTENKSTSLAKDCDRCSVDFGEAPTV